MTAHVHAQLMLQYAQDAQETDKPWERWEVLLVSSRNEWRSVPSHPLWNTVSSYRRKPITIKVNGFDVPKPLESVPEYGNIYAPSVDLDFTFYSVWSRTDPCVTVLLQRRVLHATKEAAEAHAKALLGIDPNFGE